MLKKLWPWLNFAGPGGLIHYSDRGSQYASHEYQNRLKQYGMTCSMSRKEDCWDNGVVGSFFHTLKVKCTHENRYRTREKGRAEVIDYIEMFYSSDRLHSTLGYVSLIDFESEIRKNAAKLCVLFFDHIIRWVPGFLLRWFLFRLM